MTASTTAATVDEESEFMDSVRPAEDVYRNGFVMSLWPLPSSQSFIRGHAASQCQQQPGGGSASRTAVAVQCVHTADSRFRDQLLQLFMHAGHAAYARRVPRTEPAAAQRALSGGLWSGRALPARPARSTRRRSSSLSAAGRAGSGRCQLAWPYSAERDGRKFGA